MLTSKNSNLLRAALTPREFGSLFGKSATWTYRLIYDGKLRVIKPRGRILIPLGEIDRLNGSAHVHTKRVRAVVVHPDIQRAAGVHAEADTNVLGALSRQDELANPAFVDSPTDAEISLMAPATECAGREPQHAANQ